MLIVSRIVGWASIATILAGALSYLWGALSLDGCNNLLLAATVAWFVSMLAASAMPPSPSEA